MYGDQTGKVAKLWLCCTGHPHRIAQWWILIKCIFHLIRCSWRCFRFYRIIHTYMYNKQKTYYVYQTMQKKTKQRKRKHLYCCGRLKRYVLRLDLNSFKDDVWRSDMGRLFQSFGPTCENACSPQVCLICGNCKACDVDEQRLREGL